MNKERTSTIYSIELHLIRHGNRIVYRVVSCCAVLLYVLHCLGVLSRGGFISLTLLGSRGGLCMHGGVKETR